ncbi:hypothetical protein TNIN_245661 [Trichonephila inaurata madagascariensis]|uniref:Uncharacterized protein n=1 Tax=Trichonephila inaurata madagascariensis TaxID=2747483 RepID=A0A8X6Y7H6_9ARAC|nr:hypothetical protein TNIN_245661 [Trichonephila inaurata madagascariensis]
MLNREMAPESKHYGCSMETPYPTCSTYESHAIEGDQQTGEICSMDPQKRTRELCHLLPSATFVKGPKKWVEN